MILVDWSDVKVQITLRGSRHQHIELSDSYIVAFYDGPFHLQAKILKDGGADVTEYEATYKATANKTIIPTDTDGSQLSRVKTTKTGWHYQPHAIEFTTADHGAVYNKKLDPTDFFTETDLGFTTLKIYDASNVEITDPANEGNAVKTVLDWMPTHDYEIIGGLYFQNTVPATDVKLWIIGVPDVPPAYGGSVPFGQGGINLKHVGSGRGFSTDGRSSKFMLYDATNKTSKFRLILKHGAGVKHTGMIIWEIYKAP